MFIWILFVVYLIFSYSLSSYSSLSSVTVCIENSMHTTGISYNPDMKIMHKEAICVISESHKQSREKGGGGGGGLIKSVC